LVGRSARANGFYEGRVGVFDTAVGNSSDPVEMSINEHRNGYAYVRDDQAAKHLVHGGASHYQVPQTTLDIALGAKQEIDLVVMDVEGSEERVWDGMQGLLERNPKMQLVLEFTPMFFEDPMRFAKKLTSFGHKVVEILENGEIEEIDPGVLCAKYQTNIALLK
jgi:FkbM family methyltransferase